MVKETSYLEQIHLFPTIFLVGSFDLWMYRRCWWRKTFYKFLHSFLEKICKMDIYFLIFWGFILFFYVVFDVWNCEHFNEQDKEQQWLNQEDLLTEWKRTIPSVQLCRWSGGDWFLKNSLLLVLFVIVLEDGPSGFLSHYFPPNCFPWKHKCGKYLFIHPFTS